VKSPGFLGEKLGMTQVFDESGSAIAVTAILVYENYITQVKSPDKDGYAAIQVGAIAAKDKHMTKARIGHLKKNNISNLRVLREFRISEAEISQFEVGSQLSFDWLADEKTSVDVTGQSIGKGTMGNIRRWGHHRGPMSHGSKNHRLPGSIGAGTTPGRVYKGLQMAGKTGNDRVTTQNLQVVRFIPDKSILLVKGSVPGVEGGLLIVKARRPRAVKG
jgi:large subunit ribosomal protein L3